MTDEQTECKPGREDYERALRSMATLIDVGVDDLMTLAQRAQRFAAQRATESLRVSEVMSHPVHCVRPETRMSEAAHLMVSQRISGLPVVDEDKKLVGIITEADFLRGLGVPAHHPSYSLWQTLENLFKHIPNPAEPEAPEQAVASHMEPDVVCVSPGQCIDEAIALMKQHRVKRLLVCKDKRHVEGVVTRSDLVRIFFDRYLNKQV